MVNTRRSLMATLAGLAITAPFGLAPLAAHASAQSLSADGRRALDRLYASDPDARRVGAHAHAILVFPSIIKGALVFGGETGNGVLLVRGRGERFYNISAASWGLQIGGKSFSYALFFMDDKALNYLRKSAGFSIGADPSIVIVDVGAGANVNTTTVGQDVYAFPFGAKGLLAGISIQGSKITPIHP